MSLEPTPHEHGQAALRAALATSWQPSRSPLAALVLGAIGLSVVGVLDLVTGFEIAVSPFYLFPVVSVAHYAGRRWGLLAAVLAAITWGLLDVAAGHLYTHPVIAVWNSVTRLAFFGVAAWLYGQLRETLQRERMAATHDGLTGALNRRALLDAVELELERGRRSNRPWSLLYIDLDNFKQLNDRHGHAQGDLALRAVVDEMRRTLRQLDQVARIGGDELVVLLPETAEAAAHSSAQRLRDALEGLFKAQGWPLGLSMGALTVTAHHASVNDYLQRADGLMYQAKHGGKAHTCFGVFEGLLTDDPPP
ncbi:MAG: diguanylate cyclase [Pseudomonadota bacterium]